MKYAFNVDDGEPPPPLMMGETDVMAVNVTPSQNPPLIFSDV